MPVFAAGCSTIHQKFTAKPWTPEPVAVTVRFVTPPQEHQFAWDNFGSPDGRLVRDGEGAVVNDGLNLDSFENFNESNTPAHVVLWGGNFRGSDVTYYPTPLTAGPYMFGMFDPNNGAAYQGWIGVNNGGDDVLSALNEWRTTVREQQSWLAFAYKMEGKFESGNPKWFDQYHKDLKSLRNLEKKVQGAIIGEMQWQKQQRQEWNEVLTDAQILLMPGQGGFFSPSTKPAFTEEDLADIEDGTAVTKVVLLGNFERSMEKLNWVMDLQDEMWGMRNVFQQESQRLENRRHWLQLTDHLYHHGDKFVRNEAQLQECRALIAKIDRQIDDYRRYCHALLFTTGLFAPDETFDAFDRQEAALRRDRVVWQEWQNQLNSQFNELRPDSPRRVYLERQRQDVIAQIEKLDYQIEQIDETRLAVSTLRENTEVIHRHGPAQVLAATLMGNQIPAMFANAVEQESLMTIRLQAADELFTPPSNVTKVRSTYFENETFWGPNRESPFPCEDEEFDDNN
jgi:hypothetical protein